MKVLDKMMNEGFLQWFSHMENGNGLIWWRVLHSLQLMRYHITAERVENKIALEYVGICAGLSRSAVNEVD